MKKVFGLLVIVIGAGVLSFSSCATSSGFMNNSASLSEANFSYIQTSISGKAKTLKVLGMGGLGKSAIVDEAKQEMLKNHPLQSNQALANVTINWQRGFYFVVVINKCTVTADVVEFK